MKTFALYHCANFNGFASYFVIDKVAAASRDIMVHVADGARNRKAGTFTTAAGVVYKVFADGSAKQM